MKKLVLSASLLLGLASAHTAQAQAAALINLFSSGVRLGVGAATQPRLTAEQQAAADKALASQQAATELAAAGPAVPTELVLHRTPTDQLPKQAAQQVTNLEALLDRCHAAMLASATGPVCSPEQRAAIRDAAMRVAYAKSSWDLRPYQQEMAFYMAEDDRRQLAATPAAPVK